MEQEVQDFGSIFFRHPNENLRNVNQTPECCMVCKVPGRAGESLPLTVSFVPRRIQDPES